jgi:predicted DNA-binding transcriptional regulator YafY
MSQAARIGDFVAIIENSHLPVSWARLMDELGVSAATFKCDLDLLRDQMHAPIKWATNLEPRLLVNGEAS